MSRFTITGTFQRRTGDQPFEREVEAPNESVACDRVYSQFGAEHGLKRPQIAIDEVAAAEAEA